MILPSYKEVEIKDTKSQVIQKIRFDKICVRIYGDAKDSRTEIKFSINPGCRRRNINLSMYINAINDYLISHPVYKEYENKVVNLFDFSCVKFLDFRGLKFSSNEFQLIKGKYPNILSVSTEKCTIYKEASMGCLKCNYYDTLSDIISLDSFDGFSGKSIHLYQTHIVNMNKNILHLNNICTKLDGVNIDYEYFFLTTDAPKMRKIKIGINPKLSDKDLLFISGFYNLESVQINAILSNYEQLEKLERLRKIRYILCSKQSAFIQNRYQEFLHKLYVPRLERVKWKNKITTNDLERIKEELVNISNLPSHVRKDLSRETCEYTIFDSLHHLDFDKNPSNVDEDILLDSRPFGGGIQYYVKKKRIILDK